MSCTGHNAVTPVRLEPAAFLSRVLSTLPLLSHPVLGVVSSLAVPRSIPLHMSTGQKSKNNPNKHFDGGVGAVAPILKRIHNPDK